MSLGEQLVKLREAKGLSLEELADETHIGPHVLKELEADDFSRLSAAIYGSGFVKILAKYYGIDAAPLRETFEREYREWTAGRDALPRRKTPPLKFGAGRHVQPPASAPAPAPARQTARQAARTEPRPPIPKPAPAEKPAPVEMRVEPSARADEPEGDLFGEPPPRKAPLPPAPPPVARRDDAQPDEGRMAKDERRRTKNEEPTRSEGAAPSAPKVAEAARKAWGAFVARAGRMARSPMFQRVGIAALVVAVAAWVCALFVGGEDPAVKPGVAPVASAPAAPAPAPVAPAPVAQVVETPPPAPEPVVEQPVAVERKPRFVIVGSALTDNLLPPPDCYAE